LVQPSNGLRKPSVETELSIERITEVKAQLTAFTTGRLHELDNELDTLTDVAQSIRDTLIDEPPFSVREGGFIRKGYNAEVDRLHEILSGGKGLLADIETREKEKTGIRTLKIGYNKVFGYYIEVSNSFKDLVPDTYIRKQTLVNGERYITEELKNLEQEILTAGDRDKALEFEIFTALRESVTAESVRIQRAAGPELLQECRTLGGCRTGEAKITGAYRLPCRYIIHTVGPVWNGGKYGEREQLASCYRTSLALAKEHGCETVAFPLISSGIFGYPKDQALRVAVDTIGEFLLHNDMTVYIVIFSRTAYQISSKLFADIAEYVDDHYVDAHTDSQRERLRRMSVLESRTLSADAAAAPMAVGGLDSLLAHLDAGFSETLLKLIDRSGKKDSEIYKKANVDRKLFSKIRNNPDYKPSKPTAIAFAIALELNLDETRDLVARAGYALSASSKFDVIIEYFIRQKKYDIFEINEALFAFDQSLLGA